MRNTPIEEVSLYGIKGEYIGDEFEELERKISNGEKIK